MVQMVRFFANLIDCHTYFANNVDNRFLQDHIEAATGSVLKFQNIHSKTPVLEPFFKNTYF